ncbi:MAG: peptide chain release factor 1 [Rhodothermales bacterium]
MLSESHLKEIRQHFAELTAVMARPEIATDPTRMAELGREHARLEPVIGSVERYLGLVSELEDLRSMRDTEDAELVELVADDIERVESELEDLEDRLEILLLPTDPLDEKNAIVEIRAGTGGDEASLFAGDLYRLYLRFGEANGWKLEVLSSSPGTQGGFKEIIFGLAGTGVFGSMKYESGVHRVQRVPATESSGRIHTSAATVAVLPEAAQVDVNISAEDLEIDVYRSSGPGGQSVNTTDSAVRITHIPSGLVVTCQDEKSQLKNKDKAMRVLRARLFEMEQSKLDAERSEARRSMVGSGDRSAKIRTYNWPQGRVTDHRLEGDDKNHALQRIIDGDLSDIHRALKLAENARRLAGEEYQTANSKQ